MIPSFFAFLMLSAQSGSTGVWEQRTLPGFAPGDAIQSVVADPVNPGHFYCAAGNNDGRKIKWWRTTDFGDTWTLRNDTAMGGNPWGFSIDPNPSRSPATLPTLYSPAGYGSLGCWKSLDGAATWTQLAGCDTAFAPYNPFGPTDLYHTCILPDDPPNHVLVTYHYYFKNNSEGGFGETWDGGTTWVVHPPPVGVGTSHYVLPISGTTWCVIAQDNNGANGIWRTTTAGRTGGTAGAKYRDGTISAAAWSKVSSLEHMHGSFQAWKSAGGDWYVPAWTRIGKSADGGAAWQTLAEGNWPGTFNGVRSSNIVGTAAYVYTNYTGDPEHGRALLSNDTVWDRAYGPATTATGGAPYGTGVGYSTSAGKYVLLMGTYDMGMWRFIEPAPGGPPTAPTIVNQPAAQTVSQGAPATFSVGATGTGPMSYQWRRNGATIGGATASSYTTPATTAADNGIGFDVIVTNSVNSATSNAATLTVTAPGGGGGGGTVPGSGGKKRRGCGLLGMEAPLVVWLLRRRQGFGRRQWSRQPK